VGELGERVAAHDRGGRGSYGARRWTAMSSGKSRGQHGCEVETTGAASAPARPSSARRARPDHRRHGDDQGHGGGDVEARVEVSGGVHV
jgi:hypothetical protein